MFELSSMYKRTELIKFSKGQMFEPGYLEKNCVVGPTILKGTNV